MFNLSTRIKAFAKLGQIFSKVAANNAGENADDQALISPFNHAINRAKSFNGWFEAENIRSAFAAWAEELTEENLQLWMGNYPRFKEPDTPKNVAIIMAGNIPLVGFHDFLTVLLCGHQVQAKMAKDDAQLLPVIIKTLVSEEPAFETRISLVERVHQPAAVIATGSNNSARYFESYFGKYPHIIRKNRTSVAVIQGNETHEQLQKLGEDLFAYFGLGCRNVSKIYVPEGYDLNNIFSAIVGFGNVTKNNKYANNYDYYRAIYMLNKVPFLENGFVLFREDAGFHTPISVIHYEYYNDAKTLEKQLEERKNELQCVVGNGQNQVPFGGAQQPKLWDYADGVDTVKFLESL